MPITKNALIRYQALDRCFRNKGRMYFIEDLLEECNKALFENDSYSEGIQKRQLFDDIKFMESKEGWSIPLEKLRFGKKVYYRYEDCSFSINNQPLNPLEVEQIQSALQVISRFKGAPQFEWIEEMIPLLKSKFGLLNQEKPFIEFESNIDLKGLHHFSPLFNAINNNRVIKVEYKDFKSPESYVILFHPYYLKQYNNRWFVFGLNMEKDIPIWNLALDRIESLEETNHSYIASDIDWEEYFFDIIGVTKPSDGILQEVKLHFSNEIAPYVITKPLHPSQKHKVINNGVEVKINVILNKELEQKILSFGENVSVISPSPLKEILKARHMIALKLYK